MTWGLAKSISTAAGLPAVVGLFLLTAASPALAQLQFKVEPLPPVKRILPQPAQDPPARRLGDLMQNQIIIRGRNVIGLGNGGIFITNDDSAEPVTGSSGMEPDPGGTAWLEFGDGTHLHGTLEALEGDLQEVIWRRTDIPQSLSLPLAQISRVVLSNTPRLEPKLHSILRFAGTDWLAAEVLSFQDGHFHLKLGEASSFQVDRSQVHWVSFGTGAAPECYEGPRDMSGWISSGSWTFRDGALRNTAQPSAIGRLFEALPDHVQYDLEIQQDTPDDAFAVLLHTRNLLARGFSPGAVQFIIQGDTLRLWAQNGENVKAEQTDISAALRAPGRLGGGAKRDMSDPLRLRVFENFPSGRLVVFVNDQKVGDWNIGKGKAGENRGGLSFQPMVWNSESQLAISKVRVVPWDGRLPSSAAEEAAWAREDRVVLADGELRTGRLTAINAETLKLETAAGAIDLPRTKVSMLKLSEHPAPAAEDQDDPMARVRLAQRGEIGALALTCREGKVFVRTSFGELTLPLSALRDVEMLGAPWNAPSGGDTLVFKSGDRLHGWLESAGEGAALHWRITKTGEALEVDAAHAAGVLFDRPATMRQKAGPVVSRFRNGDWLAGQFITLDRQDVIFEVPYARQRTFPREAIQALYFPTDGQAPVLDGATDPAAWLRRSGLEQSNPRTGRRNPLLTAGKISGPWEYFDGAYILRQPQMATAEDASSGPAIGRLFPAMPESVEFSFDLTSKKGQLFFGAQLFSEPENPGYMLQVYSEGLNLYDVSPRQRGVAMTPLQVQFGNKVKRDGARRHIRVLADRPSGRVAIFIDDTLVGQFPPKPFAQPRRLGAGVLLSTQPGMSCTVANLWVGPWNGLLPATAPGGANAGTDSVLLANGDETRGTVTLATPGAVRMNSELGAIDLPAARMSMIDFGGESVPPPVGARVRLAEQGALTVRSFQVANGVITCQGAVVGELTLPLEALRELAFAPPAKPAEKARK